MGVYKKSEYSARYCRRCFRHANHGDIINKRFICNVCQGKPITGVTEETDTDREYKQALRKSRGL